MSKKLISAGGDVYVSVSSGIKYSASISTKDSGGTPSMNAIPDKNEMGTSGGYHNWGEDNMHPRNIRLMLEQSTIAAPLIYKSVCRMFGIGVQYYYEEYKEGKRIQRYETIPEVDEFFEVNNIDYLVLSRMMDYRYYNNIFCEAIMTDGLTKVTEVYHREAEFCRLAEQDEKGMISHIGYYGDWSQIDEEKIQKITFWDWRRDSFKESLYPRIIKTKKFAIHSKFPSPGRTIYGVPPHHGLFRKKGWLSFSNAIPEILAAMVDNGMTIKYHIKIPANYWKAAYPKWDTLSEKEKKNIKEDRLTDMDKWLTGRDNVMKSFITEYATDKISGKPLPGWEIEAISDKTSISKELLSSQESDQHISRALGEDPSIAGLQPQGGKMGAGSGSDKRTAFVNALSMTPAEEMIIFDFLYAIKKINNWPTDLRFGFLHNLPETLDKEPSGVKTI